MDLLARVHRTIREHDLAGPATRVVVALSGGSDSVALAHLVHVLDARGELRAAGIAHFNHQLRPTADRDEQLAANVARSLGLRFVADREDVAARARRERRSVEDAARRARYEFFDRARTELAGDVVALGHTRDDQAETFLLRLLRGAGARGLAAMHPRNGFIIRPLIDCRRADLRAYLDERRINRESIKQFQIGFAPIGWDGLLKSDVARKFSPPILAKAGLSKEKTDDLFQRLNKLIRSRS